MQADLGGVFYEMAIRDHVRMDVLTRKAAELQRVDAALAQVERSAARRATGRRRARARRARRRHGAESRFCSRCGQPLATGDGTASAAPHERRRRSPHERRRAEPAHDARPAAVDRARCRPSRRSSCSTGGVGVARATTTLAKQVAAAEAADGRRAAAGRAGRRPTRRTTPCADGGRRGARRGGRGGAGGASCRPRLRSRRRPPRTTVERRRAVEPPAEEEPKPSKIKHVFVITLAGRGFDAAFGPASTAPYLATRAAPEGRAADRTTARSARGDLPDYLAMVGGQPPNDDTRAGCPTYTEIPPTAKPSKTGEIDAKRLRLPEHRHDDRRPAQRRASAAGAPTSRTSRRGRRPKATCRRPDSNAADDTLTARPGDGYATRHNPFVYFHSLLDLGDCDASDRPLDRARGRPRGGRRTTPSLSYIAPNLCNDGTESPCVDGNPGGLPAADAFLATWVPKILASPAYEDDGLLIVHVRRRPRARAGGAGRRQRRAARLAVRPGRQHGRGRVRPLLAAALARRTCSRSNRWRARRRELVRGHRAREGATSPSATGRDGPVPVTPVGDR